MDGDAEEEYLKITQILIKDGTSWLTLPATSDLPTPRVGVTSVISNNKIMLVGGGRKLNNGGIKALSDIIAFDPMNEQWKLVGELSNGRRFSVASSVSSDLAKYCQDGIGLKNLTKINLNLSTFRSEKK